MSLLVKVHGRGDNDPVPHTTDTGLEVSRVNTGITMHMVELNSAGKSVASTEMAMNGVNSRRAGTRFDGSWNVATGMYGQRKIPAGQALSH
jgi:hypothetical protein